MQRMQDTPLTDMGKVQMKAPRGPLAGGGWSSVEYSCQGFYRRLVTISGEVVHKEKPGLKKNTSLALSNRVQSAYPAAHRLPNCILLFAYLRR